MENLKMLREEAGLSQQKLADQLGLTQQSVHGYENSEYEPDITTMKLIADFFNTSVDYLIGNTEIRRRIEKIEPFELNAEEADIVQKYRSLSQKDRKSLQLILDSLL
jgi:transcriptional regulator with XRE-family HTH domain